MGIFGELDAATISSSPFFVEQGEYEAEVTAAYYREGKDNVRQLFIQYTINSEESEYLDAKVNQYFNLVDADMTAEKLNLLPPAEKATIRKNLSNLKRALCGNEGNSHQPGLGVNPDDLNDANWDPKSLVGTKVTVVVYNYGEKNTGTGVRWANLIQN